MADSPDTDGDGDHADKDQRDKHKDPHVPVIRQVVMMMTMKTTKRLMAILMKIPVDATASPGVKIVGTEELEHKEEEVDSEADEHGLVLDVLLRVQPGLRTTPPDVRANGCSSNCDAFPDPERDED